MHLPLSVRSRSLRRAEPLPISSADLDSSCHPGVKDADVQVGSGLRGLGGEGAEKKDAGPVSSECAKAPEQLLAALTRPQGRKLELASNPPVTFHAEELID